MEALDTKVLARFFVSVTIEHITLEDRNTVQVAFDAFDKGLDFAGTRPAFRKAPKSGGGGIDCGAFVNEHQAFVTKTPRSWLMNLKHKAAAAATMVSLIGVVGTAQAAFEGRLADFTASATCTASGASKCTYFYDTTLDITILNDWNIGTGPWSASAAPGSAQALAASAGQSVSGLSGWVLPTGDGPEAAGAQNQYLSIWNSAGSSFSGLSAQFDGVQNGYYASSTAYALLPGHAWFLLSAFGVQGTGIQDFAAFAVAVRPGDVVAAIPEPQTYALLLAGLGALAVAVRRRPR